jgi:hypothetical protein
MPDSKPKDYFPAGDRVSIFLRRKIWYANYQQDGRQVRRSLNTRSKREAILRAQRIEAELSRGEAPAETVNATIGAAVDAYLQHHETEDRPAKTLGEVPSCGRPGSRPG